ncbi:MAG: ATP-grasp domain-containing protein, partial [Candidatus Parcubacteria bacterium]|nr:ATP-grasp domain-containing protein [Candidatus Parcubacteria bacterium]
MNNQCTVLITCVGALDSPSQIGSLKENPDKRPIRIIGVDGRDDCIGRYLSDVYYKVPFGGDPKYIETILSICKKEKVDVIFPASHEEGLVLAKEKKLFEKEGIKIAISDYEIIESAFNKIKAYTILKENNLPYPQFFAVKSENEFKEAAAKLGFPEKDIMMKQALGRGGRGVRILTGNNAMSFIFNEKPGSLYFNFDDALRNLKLLEKFPEVLLTEYLPGEYYSVDFLAKDG